MGSHASANNAKNTNNARTLQPRRSIRRFDIFAEYNRLKGLDTGMDEPHAKGYGLWVAKVVASGGGRRAGSYRTEPPGPQAQEDGERHEEARKASTEQEWHELGGEPQTDALFDREIIQRMGTHFYAQVFAPAIAQAVEQGRSYESIRDTLRKDWTPAR